MALFRNCIDSFGYHCANGSPAALVLLFYQPPQEALVLLIE